MPKKKPYVPLKDARQRKTQELVLQYVIPALISGLAKPIGEILMGAVRQLM
ncbi:hypothetical protein ACIRST_21900 [Kitasatospora sp. NPDC101447]|uniref:hypothetical protein n=1 Tax=Kitasatospora sp. NPDC101447 TaxID=3364102 RepID=UPI0038015769